MVTQTNALKQQHTTTRAQNEKSKKTSAQQPNP